MGVWWFDICYLDGFGIELVGLLNLLWNKSLLVVVVGVVGVGVGLVGVVGWDGLVQVVGVGSVVVRVLNFVIIIIW